MKTRFKIGDRVTAARGVCLGAKGIIARRAPDPADWVVRFDQPVKIGGSDYKEIWYDDNELEPCTVPPEARPLAVGALKAGSL